MEWTPAYLFLVLSLICFQSLKFHLALCRSLSERLRFTCTTRTDSKALVYLFTCYVLCGFPTYYSPNPFLKDLKRTRNEPENIGVPLTLSTAFAIFFKLSDHLKFENLIFAQTDCDEIEDVDFRRYYTIFLKKLDGKTTNQKDNRVPWNVFLNTFVAFCWISLIYFSSYLKCKSPKHQNEDITAPFTFTFRLALGLEKLI